jgi:hypothetical protein
MTSAELLDLIFELPELELQAVVLMRQHHPAGTRPSPEEIVPATAELISYTKECESTGSRVVDLPAIQLDAPVETYPL